MKSLLQISREDQIEALRREVEDLKRQRQRLSMEDEQIRKEFRQQGALTTQSINVLQRKLFETSKANQDAFHARETLVQPDEQLDSNDRDMIDSLVKNPGIGAVVLSVVLFVSGVQVASNFHPSHEFDDDSKDADSPLGIEPLHCEMPSVLRRPFNYVKDRFGRLLGSLVPLMMLSVQFSYIFFVFDEAYASYSGGVCPAYNISDRTTVPPYDGTDAKIRILMGFIGLYFTARTLSQMFSFLTALTDRTISNKDQSRKSWFQLVFVPVWSYIAGCGRNHPSEKQTPSGPTISRVKGKECSKCSLQGFYYTTKKTDLVNLILARIKSPHADTDDSWRGRGLEEKALMEYGVSAFLGADSFFVSLEKNVLRIQLNNLSQNARNSFESPRNAKGFILKCCNCCGADHCFRQATQPVQLGNSYVVFCEECIANQEVLPNAGRIQNGPAISKSNLKAMRANDLPPLCRFKGCDSRGACYLNTESELVNAFLRSAADKVSLPKKPDHAVGIGAADDNPCCCISKKTTQTNSESQGSIPRIALCLKHADEVEKHVFSVEWPLGSIDRNIMCKKHAVDELAGEIALRVEILALDDLGKRLVPSPAATLENQFRSLLLPSNVPEDIVMSWLELCEIEVEKISQKLMFFASPFSDEREGSSWNIWPWGKEDDGLKVGREWFTDSETCDILATRITKTLLTDANKVGDGQKNAKPSPSDAGKENKKHFPFSLPRRKADNSPVRHLRISQREESAFRYSAAIRWFAREFDSQKMLTSFKNGGTRPNAPFKYERMCDMQGCHDTARHGIFQMLCEDDEVLFDLRFCQKHAVFGATIAQHHSINFPLLPCFKTDTVCRPVLANPEICVYQDCKDLAIHDNRFCSAHSKEQETLAGKQREWRTAHQVPVASLASRIAAAEIADVIDRECIDPFHESAPIMQQVSKQLKLINSELVDSTKSRLVRNLQKAQPIIALDQERAKISKSVLEILKDLDSKPKLTDFTVSKIYFAVQDLNKHSLKIQSARDSLSTNSEDEKKKAGQWLRGNKLDQARKLLQKCLYDLDAARTVVAVFDRFKSIDFANVKQGKSGKATSNITIETADAQDKNARGAEAKTTGQTTAETETVTIEAAAKLDSKKGLKLVVDKLVGSTEASSEGMNVKESQEEKKKSKNKGKSEDPSKTADKVTETSSIFPQPEEISKSVEAFRDVRSRELIARAEKRPDGAIENKSTGSISPYQG